MELNPIQLSAVSHHKGPCLVLAGPGSGKTTVVINRIKYLIENYNVNPGSIVVITFTKAAADEMRERFGEITFGKYNVSFGTFHSLFFRIIRSVYGYSLDDIIKEGERLEALKRIAAENEISYDEEREFFSSLENDIAMVKSELLSPELIIPTSVKADVFVNVYNAYERYKNEINKIDFDDMIVKCYELLSQNSKILKMWQDRYKYILIDEFQDINKAQHECILLLRGKESNVFAVGDDDQSIYGFRGARPEFLLDYAKNFEGAKIISAKTNYRCTEEIIKLSNAVIRQNKQRYTKDIEGTGVCGKKPVVLRTESVSAEADVIAKKIQQLLKKIKHEEIAVIYRTNVQARAFVDAFMNCSISFQVKDYAPSIYSHWAAKDVMAYMRLSLDRCDNSSFARIVNKPSRYINKILVKDAINECQKDDSAIKLLHCSPQLKEYQLVKLEELSFHLAQIVKKDPYEAIRYIRKVVNYDGYIEDFAEYKGMSCASFFEVLNELEEASKNHDDIESFLNHAEKVIEESLNGKKKKNNGSGENRQFGVVLTTMHSAKGLEFDTVFIAGAVEGIIPHERSKTPEEIEEERRLFYVGLTRAKRLLYISVLKTRYNKKVKPTRFLHKFIK